MTKNEEPKTECRTPTPGKQPTMIDSEKFDRVSDAIHAVLRRNTQGIEFKSLPDAVADLLGDEAMRAIGSSAWYTTTVKLELEVRGELERVKGRSPQVVRLRSN